MSIAMQSVTTSVLAPNGDLERPEASKGRNVFDLVRGLVYERRAWQTAESLVKTGAYHVDMSLSPDDWYTWRSGIKAPCYCDCRQLNANADAREQVTDALTDAVRLTFPEANLVVGMA